MADLIQKIKDQTNEVWTQYGWIIIISNLLFGLAFVFMILNKKSNA